MLWYGHVLRKDDDHVLRRALDFEVGVREEGDDQRRHGGNRWRRRVGGLG